MIFMQEAQIRILDGEPEAPWVRLDLFYNTTQHNTAKEKKKTSKWHKNKKYI